MARRDLTKLPDSFPDLLDGIVSLIDESRAQAARSVNSIMTATYWEIGRRIVEFERGGTDRAEYGKELIKNIANDLKEKFGLGFSQHNVEQMRPFYLGWPIAQTLSVYFQTTSNEIRQTLSGISQTPQKIFVQSSSPPLWSHNVKLLTVSEDTQ